MRDVIDSSPSAVVKNRVGFDLVPYDKERDQRLPQDIGAVDIDTFRAVRAYTRTTPERIPL
jgi:hypothetical protein